MFTIYLHFCYSSLSQVALNLFVCENGTNVWLLSLISGKNVWRDHSCLIMFNTVWCFEIFRKSIHRKSFVALIMYFHCVRDCRRVGATLEILQQWELFCIKFGPNWIQNQSISIIVAWVGIDNRATGQPRQLPNSFYTKKNHRTATLISIIK